MGKKIGDIPTYRKQIDDIDTEIVRLLNERAKAALKIGAIKAVAGQKIYNPNREGEVIDKVTGMNDGPLSNGAIQEVFASVITVCREIQMS